MVAAARPRPLSAPAARPPVRPAPPRRPAAATRRHEPPPKSDDTLRLILIGAGVAIAAVVAVGVIWEFGAGRNLPAPMAGIPSAPDKTGNAAPPPTLVYRDTHDGRVVVMEVGPDGTRVKGTIDKSRLPMAGDFAGGAAASARSASGPTSGDRVNALGSAFR